MANWSRIAFHLLMLPLEPGGCVEKQRSGSGVLPAHLHLHEVGKGESVGWSHRSRQFCRRAWVNRPWSTGNSRGARQSECSVPA